MGSSSASCRIEPIPTRTSNHLYNRFGNGACCPGCSGSFPFGIARFTRAVLWSESADENIGNELLVFRPQSYYPDRPLSAALDPKSWRRPSQTLLRGTDR